MIVGLRDLAEQTLRDTLEEEPGHHGARHNLNILLGNGKGTN